MSFQWWCLLTTTGSVLNVGSCDDPLGFGHRVVHFDYDDWSEYYIKRHGCFVQGDAHYLTRYFKAGSFELVIMGDIIEHLTDPYQACGQAALVTNRYLCMSIWEEWRGPGGDGQIAYIEQQLLDEATEEGYETFAEKYAAENPGCKPNTRLPHWGHIQKLTDGYIKDLVGYLCEGYQMHPVHLFKAGEVVHEGHQCFNWLILLEKVGED